MGDSDQLGDGAVVTAVAERAAIVGEQTHTRRFPVVETFGPTIQGEGPEAGLPVAFVRFGGCDYRCSWCDSMHAVEPAEVRKAERLTVDEIVARLPSGIKRVILSGGNPALLELGDLVDALHAAGISVAVETQGSVWRDWLTHVDMLVVSPKPPSSGMDTPEHMLQARVFMGEVVWAFSKVGRIVPRGKAIVKIVVFDEADYEWALDFDRRGFPLYLSAGTLYAEGKAVLGDDRTKANVCNRYRWLCEMVANDPRAQDVVALPQLHVLAWGTKLGV